jgi:hypothetical protein
MAGLAEIELAHLALGGLATRSPAPERTRTIPHGDRQVQLALRFPGLLLIGVTFPDF